MTSVDRTQSFASRAVIYEPPGSFADGELERALDVATRLGVVTEHVRVEGDLEEDGNGPRAALTILSRRSDHDVLRAARGSEVVWILAESPRGGERLIITLDPSEDRERRALERRTVKAARRLARNLGLEVHAFTGWQPPRFPSYLSDAEVRSTVAGLRAHAHGEIDRTAEELGIPRTAWHIREGPPESSLREVAFTLDAYAIVTGTFARRGLGRLVLGNWAERVAGSLPDHHVIVIR